MNSIDATKMTPSNVRPSAKVPTKGNKLDVGQIGGIVNAGMSFLSDLDIGGYKSEGLSTEQSIHNAIYGDPSADPLANMVNNLAGWGVKTAQNNILEDAASWNTNAMSNADLLSDWDTIGLQQKQSNNMTVGEGIGQAFSSAGQGAMSGLSIGGPWGALIGGVAGLGAGLTSIFTAEDRIKKINQAIDEGNRQRLSTFANRAETINRNNALNNLINYSACGGPIKTKKYNFDGSMNGIFSNNVTIVNEGGTHEKNPIGGVLMGVDPQGIPNLVEEGEVIYNDYVYSNRLKLPKEVKEKLNIKKNINTFAEAAKSIQKESEERPNDPISKDTLDANMSLLASLQEDIKMKKERRQIKKVQENTFDAGGLLQYAPIINSGLQTMLTAFTPVDYTNAERLDTYRKGLSTPRWTPIGDKLTYTPEDPYYLSNMIGANAAAQRNAIIGNSLTRGQATSSLLASDLNTNRSLGEAYRAGRATNFDRKAKVAEFNRATNLANAEGFMKAALAKQERDKLGASLLGQEIALRDAYDNAKASAISANMNNMSNNLFGLYRQKVADNQLAQYLEMLYGKKEE